MRGLSDELIDRMLAQHDARPKVMELEAFGWPTEVYWAWIGQDPKAHTHHVPPVPTKTWDGLDETACGVPVNGKNPIAPADQQPTCIACAIARGASPESFLAKAVA